MRHQPGLTANAVATTHAVALRGVPSGTAPGGTRTGLDRADAALLALADVAPASRITLVLPGALDLACALMHLGCTDVATARLTNWPHAGQADVVIVPHVGSHEVLCRAVAFARRTLAPLGTAVFRLAPGLAADATWQARAQLLAAGFSAVRQHPDAGATGGASLLRAELPMFGLRQCA